VKGPTAATSTFECSIDIDAAPKVVFGYFTDPVAILEWIGDHAVLDAQPGGEFTLDIEGIPVRGRYVHVEAPERIVVTWGHAGSATMPPESTEVEFTFVPTSSGTHVKVAHRLLPDEHAASHQVGWPMFLDRLRGVFASAENAPVERNE